MSIDKSVLVSRDHALIGRDTQMPLENAHFVNGHILKGDFPEGFERAVFGLGCFWGAERKFWSAPGVFSTAVGYAAGFTPNPSYEEVCSGLTGHNEVVLVVFDPVVISYPQLLEIFWYAHNPTQGMAQGNDRGTQYRSGIYTFSETQQQMAQASAEAYQAQLTEKGFPAITTEIISASEFYYAENYHQQYLAKNPGGYCGLGGTGVEFVCE